MTDELLDRLSTDLRPARRDAVRLRLAAALAVGGAVALAGVVMVMGLRPDMPEALGSAIFWVKLAYTVALAGVGVWAVERLSRPGGVARRLRWIALPVLGIAGLAVLQLAGASPEMRRPLMMGASAAVCPGCIVATSLPLFVGLIWAMRGLAPTRLGLAGAAAGLTAGGAGAAIYALHCPETGAPFVALWYSLGVVLAGAAGALIGPRLLRW